MVASASTATLTNTSEVSFKLLIAVHRFEEIEDSVPRQTEHAP